MSPQADEDESHCQQHRFCGGACEKASVIHFYTWPKEKCPWCESERLKAKLEEVARLLDEGAYGMATDEARSG